MKETEEYKIFRKVINEIQIQNICDECYNEMKEWESVKFLDIVKGVCSKTTGNYG